MDKAVTKTRSKGLARLSESYKREKIETNNSYKKVKEAVTKKLFLNKREFERIKNWNTQVEEIKTDLAFEIVHDGDPINRKLKFFEINFGRLGMVGKYVRNVNNDFYVNLFK